MARPPRRQQINLNTNQPIVHKIRMDLAERFPFFAKLSYAEHWSGVGGYNDRERRAGGDSDHAQGRAVDIYLLARKKYEKLLGDKLANMFWDNHIALGVDHVIWDGEIWSNLKNGTRPIQPSDGLKPHDDHVHVSFTLPGSQTQPALLTRLIRELRSSLDDELYRQHAALGGRVEGLERPLWRSPYDTDDIVRATPRFL